MDVNAEMYERIPSFRGLIRFLIDGKDKDEHR